MLNKNSFAYTNDSYSILKRMPVVDISPFKENKEEYALFWEEEESTQPPTDIVAYNDLRSCAELQRMYNDKQIDIQPEFQRGLVWSPKEQTRFIDSVIKQLPIPSMCISHDSTTEKRLIIDGLQRINTIISFLNNDDYTLSNLKDISSDIAGKTAGEIKRDHPTLYTRLQNWSIPITVIRCNYDKPTHMQYLYTIFHRLNSGGTKLNNQEIRNCIFSGTLNDFIKNTVKYPNYVSLFNIKDKNYRFAFEELNLRFFAFSENLSAYEGNLGRFLNTYMYDNERNKNKVLITQEEIEIKRAHFNKVIDLIYIKIFNKKGQEKFSKSIIEAVMVGVGKNTKYISSISVSKAAALYDKLKADDEFSPKKLKENLQQRSKVIARLERAIQIFSGK